MKKVLIPLLLSVFLLASCAPAVTLTPTPTPTLTGPEVVTFPDENLKAAVSDALGKPPALHITVQELAMLAELSASGWDIADLSGIEYCSNLTELYLSENQISDLSPLSPLTSLWELGLIGNQISDLSPLSNLTNLTKLYLDYNQISDISALVLNSGLGAGDQVSLSDNNLDLWEGSEDLKNIRQLEERGVEVHHDPIVSRP